MNKFGYMYVEGTYNTVDKIDNQTAQHSLYKSNNLENEGLPIKSFLAKAGLEGWEVITMCNTSETGERWRMILKRTL